MTDLKARCAQFRAHLKRYLSLEEPRPPHTFALYEDWLDLESSIVTPAHDPTLVERVDTLASHVEALAADLDAGSLAEDYARLVEERDAIAATHVEPLPPGYARSGNTIVSLTAVNAELARLDREEADKYRVAAPSPVEPTPQVLDVMSESEFKVISVLFENQEMEMTSPEISAASSTPKSSTRSAIRKFADLGLVLRVSTNWPATWRLAPHASWKPQPGMEDIHAEGLQPEGPCVRQRWMGAFYVPSDDEIALIRKAALGLVFNEEDMTLYNKFRLRTNNAFITRGGKRRLYILKPGVKMHSFGTGQYVVWCQPEVPKSEG